MSRHSFFAVAALAMTPAASMAQLRVASWNTTNYGGGNIAAVQTAVYGVYQGRSMAPDVILQQECLSAAATAAFLGALNTAPGSPGDWAAAPFTDGADTDNSFYYRTSKVDFLGGFTIAVGSSSTANQPRDTDRYDIRLKGYTSPGASVGMYSAHMKAQGGTNDVGRRQIEAQRIRDNAEGQDTNGPGSGLPAGFNFLFGGDTNIQSSSSVEYQEFVGSQSDNSGRFFDPINTPGSWNNNSAFILVHTQDPSGAGGMDDRHDQILLGGSLVDNDGFSYQGNPSIPYRSLVTPPFGTPIDNMQWDDPNHSYRAWGNDGTSFNLALTTVETMSNGATVNRENGMVGSLIAQAMKTMAGGGGHLAIVLNLRVPGKVDAPALIDFGSVEQGSTAQLSLNVTNVGDIGMWTIPGISDLSYSMGASGDVTAPAGPFAEPAGGSGNSHTITLDTSTTGLKTGTITIASNDPDQPTRLVSIIGEVTPPAGDCAGDANGDNQVDAADLSVLLSQFGQSVGVGTGADFNDDGAVDAADLSVLLSRFGLAC